MISCSRFASAAKRLWPLCLPAGLLLSTALISVALQAAPAVSAPVVSAPVAPVPATSDPASSVPVASAPAASPTPAAASFGAQTRYWLELQRQGNGATAYVDRLTPEAAANAAKRAQDSFSQPIPQTYIDKSFGAR